MRDLLQSPRPHAENATRQAGEGNDGCGAAGIGAEPDVLFRGPAAEIRGGDVKRMRELGFIVGILSIVAVYASHALFVAGWPQLAALSALLGG